MSCVLCFEKVEKKVLVLFSESAARRAGDEIGVEGCWL